MPGAAADLEMSGDAEQERLVDPEAGGEDDEDEELDSDDEGYYDSDEEEGDGAAKKQKKKRPPMGKWKQDLATVSQEAIPEDKLHVVAWSSVAKHTAQNMLTLMLFVAFAVVVHAPVLVSLPLFMVNFLLAVTVWEYLQQCSIQTQVGSGVLILAVIVAGVLVMGPFDFVSLSAQLLLVPLLLIVILLRCLEKPWTKTLHGTAIWQALSGRKYAMLLTQLDLAKLCKTLSHSKEPQPKFFRRMWDCIYKAGLYDYSTVKVNMVQVDESSADIADVALELNGEEIEPGNYLLTSLMHRDEAAEVNEFINMEDIEGMLKQRKFISDKLLDQWLNPLWAAQLGGDGAGGEGGGEGGGEAGKKAKETRVEKVRKWIGRASFPPAGKSQMVARFRCASYFDGLYEHWAPRAMRAVLLTAILSYPAVHVLMMMDEARRKLCDVGGPDEGSISGSLSLAGTELCGAEGLSSCSEVCESLLSFNSALNNTLHTSYPETLLAFAIIPVVVFNYSVEMSQQEHNREELIFFRRLRAPKKAITEVMRMKTTLEDVFKVSFLIHRFVTSLRAWLGADPALSACGPISEAEFDLTATRGFNDCFKQVMEPISEMKSAISCEKSELLPYGVGYDQDDEDGKAVIDNEWKMLKFRNGLGDASGRNYKVLFDLVMSTEDSWKLFKAWCKKEYKSQFDFITKASSMNVEVQDGGSGSHLTENTPIFDIVMPKGFSLTHVYVQSMPEDGMPLQIQVQGSKQGDKEFWGLCENLEHNLIKAVVDDEEEDEEEAEGSELDKRLGRYPVIARFALSEQYYNSMSSSEVQRLCGSGEAPKDFTEFVDRMLTPMPFEIPEEPEVDGKSMDLFYLTGISVFMGDESPLRAMLAAMRACLFATRVWIECLGLAMAIPLLRVFMFGKSIFPEPFAPYLILNTVSVWILLVAFFSDFHSARTRLALISRCLSLLEVKTMGSAGNAQAVSKPAKSKDESAEGGEGGEGEGEDGEEKKEEEGGEGGGDAAPATAADAEVKARAEKKAQEETRPFDMVIEDGAAPAEYEPTSKDWVVEWRRATENVRNWHTSVSYLRVFVSTSRLVAQTILVAAAFVVGFLLLMSLIQAASGDAPPAMAKAMKGSVLGKLSGSAGAGAAGQRRLHEEVGDAMETLMQERFAGQHLAAGAVAAAAEPLSQATRRLHEALAPARTALHGALLQQHDTLVSAHAWLQDARLAPAATLRAARRRLDAAGAGESMMAKVKALEKSLDVTKATKTQIYTVLMLLFVIAYSVPLMWNIVQVNGYFDRHEDLLLKHKERHRLNQAKRELRRRKRLEEAAGGAAAATGEGEEEEEKTAEEKAKTEAAAKEAGDKMYTKDFEARRYEKMLDMTIESAKKSRERFPLKLFGFVISAQLLATWVFLAASPLISQAKTMAPGLAVEACKSLESSKLIKTLQKQMDLTNPSMHIKVRHMLHDNVCVPMKGFMQTAMQHLPGLIKAQKDKLAKKVTGGKKLRRLISLPAAENSSEAPLDMWAALGSTAEDEVHEAPMPELRAIVRTWWHAHPSQHPEARYAAGHAALQELDRTGRRLLVDVPAAVVRAWQDHEGGDDLQPAFAAAMGAARPHLELAAEEASAEPSEEQMAVAEHGEL